MGGRVDTVSELNPQVTGFESREYLFLPFSNSTRHDLHDVMARFRKSLSGYAITEWVTQPVILLCLFQAIIQKNRIDIKYLFWSYQWHSLVVTVPDG